MAQRIARPIHLVVAGLLVVGLFVQFFLAGMGIFSGPAEFATHRDVGFTLTLLPLVLVVTAIVGRMGRWQAIVAAVMLVQFILQSVLVLQRDSVPAVAALHPVNGVLILLFATWLARDAWRVWQSRTAPSSVESMTPEAPTG